MSWNVEYEKAYNDNNLRVVNGCTETARCATVDVNHDDTLVRFEGYATDADTFGYLFIYGGRDGDSATEHSQLVWTRALIDAHKAGVDIEACLAEGIRRLKGWRGLGL